jgi:large subunit ribosomal protein L33
MHLMSGSNSPSNRRPVGDFRTRPDRNPGDRQPWKNPTKLDLSALDDHFAATPVIAGTCTPARPITLPRITLMAKSNTVQIKLVSTADTGFFYVTKKNARAQTTKLELNKYDPVVRKHVPFKEAKIK